MNPVVISLTKTPKHRFFINIQTNYSFSGQRNFHVFKFETFSKRGFAQKIVRENVEHNLIDNHPSVLHAVFIFRVMPQNVLFKPNRILKT